MTPMKLTRNNPNAGLSNWHGGHWRIRPAILAGLSLAAMLLGAAPERAAGQTGGVRGGLISERATDRPATAVAAAVTNSPAANAANPTKNSEGRPKTAGPNPAGFETLSAFKFTTTDEMVLGMGDALTTSQEIAAQIPRSVKVLNEKEVAITGFMLPVKVNAGKVSEFLLLKNQSMCCYGATPALNEYVSVRLAGSGVPVIMDQLITVSGTLHVGEMRDHRFLTGIYRLDGDKVESPAKP
jgi:hypothetical protein